MNTLADQTKIKFIYIANPLTPAESRVFLERDYSQEMSLAEYLGPLEGEWAVSVSGRVVPLEERALTFLAPHDCVVVAPMIFGGGGGGDGKSILRMVAMVAVSIFAPYAAGAMGFAAGTLGGTLMTAGIMIAGTMAVNALLPPPKPKTPESGASFDSSPTYGIDGPKNMSTRDIPVPVVYGECWFAGNFIQSYVENIGDDQYLNLLLNVGEGPIEGISDLQINGQPASNFTNVEIFTRLGTADQSVIPYFSDIIQPVNRSVELTTNYMLHTVAEAVDRLRVDVVMPAGIGMQDDEEGLVAFQTALVIEIREQGTLDWQPFSGSGTFNISGRQMSPVRRSFYSDTLDKSKRYDIRARHTQGTDNEKVSNRIMLTDVNYILFDDLNYKHTALLGLRIKLSDQLSGIPSVIYRVKGRKVPVPNPITGGWVDTWTDNPAWIALDAMMHTRYGGGVRPNRIKIDYFREWANFCESNNLKFNGAIDQRTNLWDALTPICKAGRGQIVRAGTRFQVAIVRRQAPTQLFTVGNIKKGSLSIDWLPADERANECHVTYFDKDDQGKQRTIIVPNMKARERGEEAIPSNLTLYGVDNSDQANREGVLAMNMQALLRTISFEAPLEAIACTLGDVVAIQHDMPQWGTGGLLEDGSTATQLQLDRAVSMPTGGIYQAMVRHDQVVQHTNEIEEIVGNVVVPGFGFNVTHFDRFRRLVNTSTGRDYAVLGPVIDQYGRHGLRLETVDGLTVGDVIRLIDTDVIETRNVQVFVGETTEITLSSPLSHAPRPGTPWAFGLTENVVTKMTVMEISGTDELWRTLSGLEYDDDAYSDEVMDVIIPPINTTPIIGNVNFLGFQERRYLLGAAYVSDVEVSWTSSNPEYAFAEVHISLDGEPWRFVDGNASIYTITQIQSGELRVKLVPVTIEGFKPSFASVTEHTYVVNAGVPANPPAPTNFRIGSITPNIIELKWGSFDAWSAAQNIYRYEIWHAPGENADIADATLLAITGNDHYPHVGLDKGTWHSYWLRTINTRAANVKSDFIPVGPGLSAQTRETDPLGLIGLTDLDDELRQSINSPELIQRLSDVINNINAKLEQTTDVSVQEVFNRQVAIGQVNAQITQQVAAMATMEEALSTRITEMEANLTPGINARLDEMESVIVNGDAALAQQIALMQVQFEDDISAAIATESQARATADSAMASQLTNLSTTVGDQTTSIQQLISSVDGIGAQYTLRIDNDGIISGFGLATGLGGTSEFVISATRFKVIAPGVSGSVPISVFQVDSTTGLVTLRNAVVGNIQSDNYVSGVSGWCLKK